MSSKRRSDAVVPEDQIHQSDAGLRLNEPCDICGSAETMETWLAVSLCGIADACVARCRQCGFRQIRLRREEIAELYPTGYFDPASPVGFRDYARQQQKHEREARFLAQQLKTIASNGKLLEVGCALGFLLNALRRRSAWDVSGRGDDRGYLPAPRGRDPVVRLSFSHLDAVCLFQAVDEDLRYAASCAPPMLPMSAER